ncbi:MAG: prepilin-type N-terminal cleavage/methylation domain-containing protein, partial [Puniceicoccales bacterium]|nr:prepilin-type N-terminal cleavage/methylation domain-containing protein [Puniceicoccales bacterium]
RKSITVHKIAHWFEKFQRAFSFSELTISGFFNIDQNPIVSTLNSINMKFKGVKFMDGTEAMKKKFRAMTLMEILIVIALIAILAGVSVSNLGGVLGSNKQKSAKVFYSDTLKIAIYAAYAANGLKSVPGANEIIAHLDVDDIASLKDPTGANVTIKIENNTITIGPRASNASNDVDTTKIYGIYKFENKKLKVEVKEPQSSH